MLCYGASLSSSFTNSDQTFHPQASIVPPLTVHVPFFLSYLLSKKATLQLLVAVSQPTCFSNCELLLYLRCWSETRPDRVWRIRNLQLDLCKKKNKLVLAWWEGLWHRVTVLDPPKDLIRWVKRDFENCLWNGHHWLPPGVLLSDIDCVCSRLNSSEFKGPGLEASYIAKTIMLFRECAMDSFWSFRS